MADDRRREDARDARFPPTLKRLGQHFLSDRRILERIADALQLAGGETVIEVGPGRGALTDVLAARGVRVVAIEIDRALAEILRVKYAGRPEVEIVERDVLEVDLAEVAGTTEFLLVGNVPYYITTPIIFQALAPPRARRMAFLVQREVAERAVAPPGDAVYGALSVNVQAVARGELAFRVPAGAFTPPPKVESAVLRLVPHVEPLVTDAEQHPFSRFVIAAFGQRRKQLRRVLRSVGSLDVEAADRVLDAAAVAGDLRPETLSPATFVALYRALVAERGRSR